MAGTGAMGEGKPWRGLWNGRKTETEPAQALDAEPKAAEVDRGISGEAALLYVDSEDGIALELRGGDRDGEEQSGGDEKKGGTGPKVG